MKLAFIAFLVASAKAYSRFSKEEAYTNCGSCLADP